MRRLQQIGRAVRRILDFPKDTIQQAHIYSPNRKAADQTWKSYLAFESAPDQYVYRGSEFVPKLGAKGLEVSDSLNFRMAVQIKTGFPSNQATRRDLYDETQNWIRKQAEFRNLICERNEDPGHFPWMLFVFEKISSPRFLSGTSFENVKLEYMLFAFSRNHVFIQASVARFPSTIQELELADPGVLTRIVPSTKLNISSIQLRNIVEAVGTVRARSFWADNANRHLSPSRDGTYAPHALRWWNKSDELNESISLNSARYSSGEVLNLPMFLDWCDDLDKKLRSTGGESHGVFQQLARKSRTTPGTPYLIRIEIPDGAILEDWNESRVQVKSGYLYIPLKKRKGKITGKITGIETRNALVSVDVTFNKYRKQFELSWSNRDKTFALTHKGAEKVDLLKWIKERRRASIMTSNGVCYVSGRLYEQRQPERRNFLSTLKKADIYSETRFETPKSKSTQQWSRSSVFGVFERDHVTATDLNGGFDVVICDDGSNEYADFVCINRAARRLVFVHCKWAKGPRLQIDDVYIVLGQAVKNVDLMWHKPDAKTCQRWRKGKYQTFRFRTILGEFTADDEAMFTDHNVIREAWVIQPSFNVDQFLNAVRRFSQAQPGIRKLAYLLDQTSITLGDRGVLFRFFGC